MLRERLPDLRAAGWLRRGVSTVIAAAPGRLDVMGGIADYSGATVLEATIGDLAVVAVQRRDDTRLRVRTVGSQAAHLERHEHTLDLADLFEAGRLRPYDAIRRLFPPDARWAAYVLGVFYVLLAEGEVAGFAAGADLLLYSSVPLGAGVASSAAIEVAAMRAAGAAYGVSLDGMRLATLCQLVENRVVGAPCGIMDQVTCTLGRAGQLLALRCQPHEILGYHAPPPGYTFVGLDSGVKHAVGGARYRRVRCAAFMGKRIIENMLGRRVAYLADVTPQTFRRDLRGALPAHMTGRAFIDRWGATDDTATAVDPGEDYPVRGATEHAIYENYRVERFARLMARGPGEEMLGSDRYSGADGADGAAATLRRTRAVAAGRAMFGSHRSYSRNCGLGSRETDLIVSLVRQFGPEHGLYGAKITGGGSGGTVAVLAEAAPGGAYTNRAAEALEEVRCAYGAAIGRPPRLVGGSSPGAAEIPPLTAAW